MGQFTRDEQEFSKPHRALSKRVHVSRSLHASPPLPLQLTTRRRSRRAAAELTRRWRDGGAEGKEGRREMSSPVLRKIAMRLRRRRRRRRPTRTQKAERDTMAAAAAAAAAVGSRTMLSLSVGFFSLGREAAPHRNRILLSRRSDSPEIEIATFPFFSSTFARAGSLGRPAANLPRVF